MSAAHDHFPLAESLARWEALSPMAKAEMRGMMGKAIAELNAAMDILERVYPPRPAPTNPARLRLV